MNPGLVPRGMQVRGLFCRSLSGCLGWIPAPALARSGGIGSTASRRAFGIPNPGSSVTKPHSFFPPHSCPRSPQGAPRNSSGMVAVPGYFLSECGSEKKRICVLRERSAAWPCRASGSRRGCRLLWDGLSPLMRAPLSARLRKKLGMAAISPGHRSGERSQGKAGWRQLGVPAWRSLAG